MAQAIKEHISQNFGVHLTPTSSFEMLMHFKCGAPRQRTVELHQRSKMKIVIIFHPGLAVFLTKSMQM